MNEKDIRENGLYCITVEEAKKLDIYTNSYPEKYRTLISLIIVIALIIVLVIIKKRKSLKSKEDKNGK